MVFRTDDLKAIVIDSQLLTVIPDILNEHRGSLSLLSSTPLSSEEEKPSVVKDLHEIARGEVSRAILNGENQAPVSEATVGCLTVLMDELKVLFHSMLDIREKTSKTQWERFYERSIKSDSSDTPMVEAKRHRHQVGRSGVTFLKENGIFTAIYPSSPQKPSSARKLSQDDSPTIAPEKLVRNRGIFFHQYLSHWIHIFVAATKAHLSRSVIVGDSTWISMIFEANGIVVKFGKDGNVVNTRSLPISDEKLPPGRYRSRFLRLLFPILKRLEPSEELAKGLFHIVGSSCS
eukprot:CAMPEP_0178771144 /NCGR_PEP_ID=MMETSP0744-20121128/21778_1 /TAXON_ID=913974 /ORGANISM="Nitzschia punctata, Strain CCMP561" /LENGTH=289 /DNA_ID=CAMNT_0020427587 /DNA_START=297 /DNA_END=1163 /DNA_ORIENTATION=+